MDGSLLFERSLAGRSRNQALGPAQKQHPALFLPRAGGEQEPGARERCLGERGKSLAAARLCVAAAWRGGRELARATCQRLRVPLGEVY